MVDRPGKPPVNRAQGRQYGAGAVMTEETEQRDVHVWHDLLGISITVSHGSPTSITCKIEQSGGFMAAYGNAAGETLKQLQATLDRNLVEFFQRNPPPSF